MFSLRYFNIHKTNQFLKFIESSAHKLIINKLQIGVIQHSILCCSSVKFDYVSVWAKDGPKLPIRMYKKNLRNELFRHYFTATLKL